MLDFLVHKFVKNPENTENLETRNSYGNFASFIGLLMNLFLFAIKLIAGLLTGAVSIIADAVNNLSDAGSSLIVLLSFKLSSMPADERHPFGHGRIEYVFSTAVGMIVLIVGFQLVLESINKIRNPEEVVFTATAAIILVISILLKFVQHLFYKNIGTRINSDILMATATDSISDVISTSAVLLSLIISPLIGFNLDGYMGAVVGFLIIKAGFDILSEMISKLLGEKTSEEYEKKIKKFILGYEGIYGVHDLIVHDYGPGHVFASAHIEVDAKEDFMKTHDLSDKIEVDIQEKYGIQLTTHLDPLILDDPRQNHVMGHGEEVVHGIDENLSIHDFRMVESYYTTNLIFDIEIPNDSDLEGEDIIDEINQGLLKVNPRYKTIITFDKHHFSETFDMVERL